MKKISTLYKKDLTNLALVINEIDPNNQWVLDGYCIPTRKFDGTSSMVFDGNIYKRYDVKKGKSVPNGAIPCQDADLITGHWPHWLLCDRNNKSDKYFFEAFDRQFPLENGTYELVGPKIQGNPENISLNTLILHGYETLDIKDFSFESLIEYLTHNDIEGIVFHHIVKDKMCKIRKSDFGIKRN